MQVTFQTSKDELLAIWRYYPRLRRWEPLLSVLGFALLGMLLASILPVLLGFAFVVTWLWAIMLGGGALLLAAAMWHGPQVDAQSQRPFTLRLTEDYWSTIGDFTTARNDWSLVRRVCETDEHLFFDFGPYRVFAIPRRAFASASEAEEFVQFARRKIAEAEPQATRDTPRWPLQEPDLLHLESTGELIHVRYRSNIKQRMEFERHGVNPPQPRGYAWLALIGLLCVAALAMASANLQAFHIVLCLIAALLSALLARQLYRIYQSWRWMNLLNIDRAVSVTLTFSPRGVGRCTATAESFTQWQAYERAAATATLVVLYGRPLAAADVVFPRSAINQPADETALTKLIEQHVKPANESADAAEMHKPNETGNPYQAPQQDS
jgi:hypothetical protein